MRVMADLELVRDESPDPRYSTPSQYVIRLTECVLDGRKNPILTKRCASLQELDTEIEAIKAKLDQIRKDARLRWGG
jgi:hypothetical protein